MKMVSTLFLRLAVGAIGLFVLALCVFALPAIWRAVPGEYVGIDYAFYGILIALYVAALPFFVALHQAIKLLHYIDKNQAFSALAVRALKRIAFCGLVISAIFAAILPFFYIWAQADDAPGLILICAAFSAASFTVTVFAATLQRLLHEAIKIKSENDLVV